MNEPSSESNELIKREQSTLKRSQAADYAGHMQEALRHGKLSSSEYHVAMGIMRAVGYGLTREQWEQEYSKTVQTLRGRTPDKNLPHTDAENQYEQLIAHLKDLSLWPWE